VNLREKLGIFYRIAIKTDSFMVDTMYEIKAEEVLALVIL